MHRLVKEVGRSKWQSIHMFLLVDLIQIAFVSILYLDSTEPFIVGIDLARTNPVASIGLFMAISLTQLFLVYLVAIKMKHRPEMTMLYPEFRKPDSYQCRYSRDEIVSWTTELAKKSEVSVNEIYLMVSPFPNAFTFSLPLVGSVVVLHSNLLDLLESSEAKSIIIHELAHIKNQDSIINIFLKMPSFFVDVIYLYVYLRLLLGAVDAIFVSLDLGLAVIRLLVFLSFFIVSRVMMTVSMLFVQRAARKAELLADYHSAATLDPVSTINALIRLGQRIEALSAFIEEIQWLHSLDDDMTRSIEPNELNRMIQDFPLTNIDENRARRLAPELFLALKLKRLREVYGLALSDDDIDRVVEPAAMNLREKRKEHHPSHMGREIRTVDWRDADTDGDNRLSRTEIKRLLEILREHPEAYMFDNEMNRNMLLLSHPNFRHRILFLAEVSEL